MTSSEQDADEKLFIKRAHDFWVGSAKVANKMSEANNHVAREWLSSASGQQRLLNLLDHPDKAVRFAAAAYLLKSTHQQKAIAMLELLENDPTGLIAPSCRLLLMRYRGGRLARPS